MTSEIIIAIISLVGTAFGSITGIMASNRLTTYRISELEKKVDKHNNLIERVALLEQADKMQWEEFESLKKEIDQIREEGHREFSE